MVRCALIPGPDAVDRSHPTARIVPKFRRYSGTANFALWLKLTVPTGIPPTPDIAAGMPKTASVWTGLTATADVQATVLERRVLMLWTAPRDAVWGAVHR